MFCCDYIEHSLIYYHREILEVPLAFLGHIKYLAPCQRLSSKIKLFLYPGLPDFKLKNIKRIICFAGETIVLGANYKLWP